MKNNPEQDPLYIEPTTPSKSRSTRGIYQCGYCGTKFTAVVSEVLAGKIRSCGCLRRSRRADHTRRQLDSWGASKTKWVGQRFLYHSRLAASARAAADTKLMKQLGIKDKDILFKAAQVAQGQALDPTRRVVDSKPNAVATVCSAPEPIKQPMAPPTQPTIIVNGDLHMHITRDPLTRDVPFWDTDEGFAATQKYFREFHQMPPESFDLKAYWTAGARLVN